MEFHPEKPCGKKYRSKERYTRAQLIALGKHFSIPGYMKMDMDELCAALRLRENHKQPQPQPSPPQPQTKCLIDTKRPCAGNSLSKNRYKLSELKELWKKECKELPEFWGKKPTKVDEYCSLLKQRYSEVMKFVPLKQVPQKVLSTLKRWLNKFSTGDILSPNQQSFTVDVCKIIPFEDATTTITELCKPHPRTFQKSFILHRIPPNLEHLPLPFDILRARTDPLYVYNRNVGQFPVAWVKSQNEYILNLPWKNKIRLLTYTHAGDKMANSFILGTFRAAELANTKFTLSFRTKIFPLALDMYLHTRRFSTLQEWLDFNVFATPPTVTTESTAKIFFETVKTESFADAYDTILVCLDDLAKKFDDKMWYLWAGEYILHLHRIFNNAPPVPKEGLYTYRGVKTTDFVSSNSKNVFVNETFLSTSPDLEAAIKFKAGRCCLFSIQVLPGAKCLFPGALTYYSNELELLFAPGRQLFIVKNQFMASNTPVLVTRFSLMN